MKQFKLVNIDNDTNDDGVKEDGDDVDEKYNDMKDSNSKQEPVISSIEKKRSNKTEQCSKCLKFCNRKTLLYSHKCKTDTKAQTQTQQPAQQTQPTQQPAHQTPPPPVQPEQPPPAPAQQQVPITEQDIHEYLQKQQKQRMEKLKEIRQARFNNLISRAF